MKELFLATIMKPPEVIVFLCLLISSSFHAVKGKRFESTLKLFE